MSEEDRQKKERMHERIQKNVLKKTKENNVLKRFEVDVVTSFIKYEVESFSDAEIYTDDDDDSEEDGVIGFR